MVKIKQESHKPDICPVCGDDNLTYDGYFMQSVEEGLHYKWKCPKCEAAGEEWYELKFIAHMNIVPHHPKVKPAPKPCMSHDFCNGYQESNCCGATISVETPFCSKCKEHATNKCADCLDPLCNRRVTI